MIVRSFQKCGISTALDGSEESLVNIEGVANYKMPSDSHAISNTNSDTDSSTDGDIYRSASTSGTEYEQFDSEDELFT